MPGGNSDPQNAHCLVRGNATRLVSAASLGFPLGLSQEQDVAFPDGAFDVSRDDPPLIPALKDPDPHQIDLPRHPRPIEDLDDLRGGQFIRDAEGLRLLDQLIDLRGDLLHELHGFSRFDDGDRR